MCTLTYLPKTNGFVLGNSRDVEASRGNSVPPRQYLLSDGTIAIYAKDRQSEGTWFATSEKGITVCLLNGGLVKHQKAPSYRKSRGLIPLEYLAAGNLDSFIENYDFDGIEPFTLVVFEHKPVKVYDLVWTGERVIIRDYSASSPIIWSSSTLYNAQSKGIREAWFREHLRTSDFETDKVEILKDFHYNGGDFWPNKADRILSYRENGVITVSISILNYDEAEWLMQFKNLLITQNQNVRLFV